MAPKDIVVFIEDEQEQTARLTYAAALAERWQAHLTAVFAAGRLDFVPANAFARGAGLETMLRRHHAATHAAAAHAQQRFDTITAAAGLSAEWRVATHEDEDGLMLHARHASLAIVGPPPRSTGRKRVVGLAVEVIFASGRPTLLLPLDWPPERLPRRIVVGWNGSREATTAIAHAMPFLMAAETVHLAVVPDGHLNGPLGADPGADMSRHLARHGVPVVLDQRRGSDAGAVLLEHARTVDADLLVMGAYGRTRLSEFVFGGTTRTVLAKAGLPILLST